MKELATNLHPTFQHMLPRHEKEALLNQRGLVIWLFGLSGSGKSTIAQGLEKKLHSDGVLTQLLDGDNIRTGLNRNLGFSDEDRVENIRRIAEVAKLQTQIGVVTIASFITPTQALRANAREIIGTDDLISVYVQCSFETCEARDVKGLYAKAKAGKVPQFTGRDSTFEPPALESSTDLQINTDEETPKESTDRLYEVVRPRIRFNEK